MDSFDLSVEWKYTNLVCGVIMQRERHLICWFNFQQKFFLLFALHSTKLSKNSKKQNFGNIYFQLLLETRVHFLDVTIIWNNIQLRWILDSQKFDNQIEIFLLPFVVNILKVYFISWTLFYIRCIAFFKRLVT